jgi:hypothetical protein
MKCEECLPLIEEYVDGELDGRIAERLGAHLDSCAGCALSLAEVEREQQLYALYQRDVEVTPAQWNVVRARIEQEKDAGGRTPRAWFGRLFGPRRQFRPAFAAASALVIIAVTAGVIYLRSGGSRGEVALQPAAGWAAQRPAKQNERATPDNVNGSGGSVVAHDEKTGTANSSKVDTNNSGGRAPLVASNRAGASSKKWGAATARLRRPENRRGEQPGAAERPARFEEETAVASVPGETGAGGRRASGSAPEAAGDFDFELARHAGRAEMVLREFRNVRPAQEMSHALDVSYEKGQSRKLLYRNIALRRAAAERGDRPAAQLLNTLEPILLDIANLPDRVRPRDLRPIERRMKKMEIVAALQVRTLVASN